MKINKTELQNVKSFREKEVVNPKEGVNIFIGPNAGGKSNLMDIINVVLGYYFIYPWRLTPNILSSGLTVYNIQNRRDLFNPIQQFLDKNLEIEDLEQIIKINFEITEEDLENLKIIKNSKDKLIEFEKNEYKSSNLNSFSIAEVDFEQYKNSILEYEINNYSEVKSTKQDDFSRLFLQYLNYFELIAVLIEEYNRKTSDENKINKLFPLTLYFSPYRNPAIQNLRVNISNQDQFNLIENYKKNTSKNTSSILEYANFYFALKLRKYKDDLEKFKKDEEVKFIEKYIKRLGYANFTLKVIDEQRNIYEVVLKKDEKEIEITKASSGEKEIINLLLGIFAFNVRGGVVIIDEPDLHLHPRWQRLLLELFNDLSKERKIQFFIVTHSPQFITYETIKNTFRVYKENGTSRVFIPTDEDLGKQTVKDVFQIINTLNNEKIFFADKVILVEGVVDRIILEKILKILQKIQNNIEVIEIIDVYGKANFKKFREFLEIWGIKNYIITDLDYAVNIGNGDIKKLFNISFEKIKDSLNDKNSRDGIALLKSLDIILVKNKNEIKEEDLKKIKNLFDYIKNRHIVLKQNISNEEKTNLINFIESQYSNKSYILKNGEIDDYFRKGHLEIQKAIEIMGEIESNENIDNEFKIIFEKIFE